mmetsp:Transcript_59024/g.97607  ORF Transcript_59024/g.97607 Transcript_59024/m.97607 type:complete len:214 (-) Transcript_59024:14-655(-)
MSLLAVWCLVYLFGFTHSHCEDTANCGTSNGLASSICIYSNTTFLNGHTTFVQSESHPCENGQPLYEHIVYDEPDDNANGSLSVVGSYFLHFFVFPNTATEWVLSFDDISGLGDAKCANEQLLNCQSGSWKVLINADAFEYQLDHSMTVNDYACDHDFTQDAKLNRAVQIVLIVLAVLLLCAIVLVGVRMYRLRVNKQILPADGVDFIEMPQE